MSMDDDSAYQLTQHTYAAIMWLFRYIKSHNLKFSPEDRVDVLEFHLNRIDSICDETEQPLSHSPVISDAILQGKRSDEDLTESPRRLDLTEPPRGGNASSTFGLEGCLLSFGWFDRLC